jgi:predicted DCC family thiol-disulfide oxidoreductase YuxK
VARGVKPGTSKEPLRVRSGKDAIAFDPGSIALGSAEMAEIETATLARGGKTPHLFYDGDCGVCHMWVRFVLGADPRGATRFAPLGGETFLRRVAEGERESLPDSLVLVTPDGRLLTRSAAVLHLLREMGGLWRGLAAVAGVVPRGLADALYDGLARRRHWIAPRPSGVCPVVPEPVRKRFDP